MVPAFASDRLSTPHIDPAVFLFQRANPCIKKYGNFFPYFSFSFFTAQISGDRLCDRHRDDGAHGAAAGEVLVCNGAELHKPVSAAGEVPHKWEREPGQQQQEPGQQPESGQQRPEPG